MNVLFGKDILRLLASIFLVLTISACGKPKDETVPAPLTGLNHTKTAIPEFYVNGEYGGNIAPMGGGGGTTCCVIVPYTYPSGGLKVKVRWNATDTLEDHWHEQEVVIDPYPPSAGMMFVHFLASGKVRVVVSNVYVGHPNYPGPLPPDQEK